MTARIKRIRTVIMAMVIIRLVAILYVHRERVISSLITHISKFFLPSHWGKKGGALREGEQAALWL